VNEDPNSPVPPEEPTPAENQTEGGPAKTQVDQSAEAWETAEKFGRPVRQFPIAISSEVLALAWARQENAPQGAAVIVDREISPLARLGRLWGSPPEVTMACSVVLRPPLSVEESDAAWLVMGLAAAEGAEAVAGREVGTSWPDQITDPATSEEIGMVKAEIQLGPGHVRCAVVTVRLDLDKLGLERGRRDDLLESVLAALDRRCEGLADGASSLAADYTRRCVQVGRRVRIRLRPKGETRGTVLAVSGGARLEIASASGMTEKIGIDQLRDLQIV